MLKAIVLNVRRFESMAVVGVVAFVIATGIAAPLAMAQDPTEVGEAEKKPKDPVDPDAARRNPDPKDPMALGPRVTGDELRGQAQQAANRGFGYLVGCQNEDGTWGSAMPGLTKLKNFGFGTTSRGSNMGVRHACTAIIAKALLRKPDRTPKQQRALERAVTALLSTEKFPYDMGEAFNTWGYGFKLDFLVDYFLSDEGKDQRDKTRAAAAVCIAGLKRYQLVDGGWNYYTNPNLGGESMSFNTANFAQALHRADRAGIDVPAGMVGDAVKLLKRMKTLRGGFVYDARFLLSPGSVNELSTAARTAACTEALVDIGEYDLDDMKRAYEIFVEGENWLEHGRKLITPHTAVHQVSGYFFFYGYYYFSEMLTRMGDGIPIERWERNAWTLVRTQEKPGEWWDTAAAGYGDKWGTGFALLILLRYLDAVDPMDSAAPASRAGSQPSEGGDDR